MGQVFFMWWILKMDQNDEIRLSCAPHWTHEDFDALKSENPTFQPIQNLIPWRDHWMQALYYAPKPIYANAGETLLLKCAHDEFSLWFDLSSSSDEQPDTEDKWSERPLCSCGFHLAYSRTRIGQMNHSQRLKKFQKILDHAIDPNSTVLFVSDGSLLGITIAALKVKHVYYIDANKYSRRVLEKYIEFNQFSNITLLESIDDNRIEWSTVTHIVGEPNFCTAILPWDNFYFAEVVREVKPKCNDNVQILPQTATIRAVPVEFLDLHKIFAPFGVCESFDLRIFDRVIEVRTIQTSSDQFAIDESMNNERNLFTAIVRVCRRYCRGSASVGVSEQSAWSTKNRIQYRFS